MSLGGCRNKGHIAPHLFYPTMFHGITSYYLALVFLTHAYLTKYDQVCMKSENSNNLFLPTFFNYPLSRINLFILIVVIIKVNRTKWN